MKVTVVFEFPEITDPDGLDADKVISEISEDTLKWMQEYGCIVWVDDATGVTQ